MKTTVLSVAALSLLQLVSAQPRRRHNHGHLEKKDYVVVTNTVIAQATEEPHVIVYVDQNGAPVSTTTKGAVFVVQTQSPATSSSSTTSAAAPPATSDVQSVDPTTTTPEPETPTPTESSTSSAAPAETSTVATTPAGDGFGLTYSPYNSDGSCKSASQVLQDFEGFGSGYSFVRTYGTDCSTVANVLAACQAHGLKLFAGIFSLSGIESQVSDITGAFGGNFDSLYAVSVGNELVNSGAADAGTVVAAIGTVRSLMRAAGFTGPVVTVDTLVAARANPSLCDSSDFCAVNCHPFFDANTEASGAGDFLTTQIATLKAVLADQNQDIVITETGWPWQGSTNGAAVPSEANQAAALSSIRGAFSSNPASLTLFNPYNMHWKTSDASQFNAEPYWGFLGDCPSG